jgi:hypothetical protein
VMIAPPNRGSPVASFLGPLMKPVCKTLDQLSDRSDSYVNRLPPPENTEIGIIAARHDLQVPRPNTQLSAARQHVVIRGLHSSLLLRRDLANQVACFLESGEFLGRGILARYGDTADAAIQPYGHHIA